MSAFIAALGYAWISHGLAFLAMPRSIEFNYRLRVIVMWAFAALALFVIQDWMAVMAVVAFAAVLFAPPEPSKRVAFFVSIAPCLPVYLASPLPFPGINFLLEASHYKLLAIFLLFPLFFARRRVDDYSPRVPRSHGVSLLDASLVLYIVYTAIVVANAVNPTSSLRFAVDQFLTLALPYFALRYAVLRTEDVKAVFEAFLLAAIVLAMISLVSTAKQWDFYWLLQPSSVFTLPDIRGGFLRINGPANTHSLGYHVAAAILVLYLLRAPLQIGWLRYRILQVVLLGGMFFTSSQGAMVGLAVACAGYFVIIPRSNLLRTALLSIFFVGCVVGGLWLLFGSTGAADVHGSISYRQLLFRIGSAQILENPVFGDYDFYRNPAFEPLRQGQGIIDITNLYLQVLLHYGFLGGILFFSVIMVPLVVIIRLSYRLSGLTTLRARKLSQVGRGASLADMELQRSVEQDVLKWRRLAATAFGAQVGWLFLVGTTSNVGVTVHIGIVFAAICRTTCDIGAQTIASIPDTQVESIRPPENAHLLAR